MFQTTSTVAFHAGQLRSRDHLWSLCFTRAVINTGICVVIISKFLLPFLALFAASPFTEQAMGPVWSTYTCTVYHSKFVNKFHH